MRSPLLWIVFGCALLLAEVDAKRDTTLLDFAKTFASPEDVARVQTALSIGTETVRYAAASTRSSSNLMAQFAVGSTAAARQPSTPSTEAGKPQQSCQHEHRAASTVTATGCCSSTLSESASSCTPCDVADSEMGINADASTCQG